MIALINGCGSNICSIQYALQRLGVESVLTDRPDVIRQASRVILPGVGHAASAMKTLRDKQLVDVITQLTQPVLGICLGMQLLYEYSEEGNTTCLGIIPGRVTQLIATPEKVVPHMGWNQLNTEAKPYVYFVHSYAAPVNAWTVTTSEHTQQFTAIVQYKNFMGMQFHPERSGYYGEQLLMRFIED